MYDRVRGMMPRSAYLRQHYRGMYCFDCRINEHASIAVNKLFCAAGDGEGLATSRLSVSKNSAVVSGQNAVDLFLCIALPLYMIGAFIWGIHT